MCYVHQTEAQAAQGGRRELTTAEWLAIAEEARKAGMVFLLLTGGEPLLRPDFPELLHALKNMGFLVSVNSNGSLARGELLRAVKAGPALRFNITLYGGSNATYERLCGRAMFQEVVDNLRALKDAGIPCAAQRVRHPGQQGRRAGDLPSGPGAGPPRKASTYMYPPVRLDDGRPGDAPHRFAPEGAAVICCCAGSSSSPWRSCGLRPQACPCPTATSAPETRRENPFCAGRGAAPSGSPGTGG